jgi:glyoxylase-like metal-dependent hydrolase (beta-lactamase superfamily II)
MAIQPASVSSIAIGDIKVTFLPDGEAHIVGAGMFPASSPEGWIEHQQWLDDDGRVVNTLGGFLVETGDRKIVVDLGFGENHVEIPDFAVFDGGRFLDSLAETKVDPGDIDTVVYTHLHVDHTGWTSLPNGDGRRLTFPNARYVVAAAEHMHWQQPDESGVGPSPEAVLQPLESHLEFVEDGQTVAQGVTVLATPGHTPGHQSIVISSGADRALILGDVLHCPAQLPEAEWGVLFDVDPAQARKTRDQLMAELEGTATILSCSHFPDAVFGRVVRGNGKRYWNAIG